MNTKARELTSEMMASWRGWVKEIVEAAEVVRDGAPETLGYYALPSEHWRHVRTNNPLERLMREIRRRTRVVGSFPEGRSALMLVAARLRYIAGTKWGTRRYGKLVVLPTRMNPDLAMGDLLKKTGAGNLFMAFGEPDVEVKKAKDGQVTAEIRGLDVYYPTTGEIRSSRTDDIAC
jgi:hypothetical protein